jgi:pimeloyl-[acyl-carrier protein] methyl ester esterase
VFDRYQLAPQSDFIELADLRVRVRILSWGEGPTVLLIHGIATSVIDWIPLAPHLAGFRLIAVDLPGHGQSDPFDYRHVDLRRHAVALLTGLLDHLELDAVPIVGHSLGGAFGLWLALDGPERVKALVGMSVPAVALPGAKPKGTLTALTIPGLNRLVLSSPTTRAAFKFFLGDVIGRHAVSSVAEEVIDASLRAGRMPGHASTVATLMERVNHPGKPRPENVLNDAELARICQPVLFVWGERDKFLSPQDARPSIDKMPNARLEVVSGGHEPWYDDPATCGQLVSEFLTQATKAGESS